MTQEDYWPKGNIYQADDEALEKLRAGLKRDAIEYKDDEDSLESINSLIFRVEEELAYRQLDKLDRGLSMCFRTLSELRVMSEKLTDHVKAAQWLLDEVNERIIEQEEIERLYYGQKS